MQNTRKILVVAFWVKPTNNYSLLQFMQKTVIGVTVMFSDGHFRVKYHKIAFFMENIRFDG